MPLERVRPQKVQSTDGWTVASAGREVVQYEEGGRKATVGVDRGHPTRVYVDTLTWVDPDGRERPVDQPEREVILQRLQEGLLFMGAETELFPSP